MPSGGVTMLRYWSSELTLWLRDVFGQVLCQRRNSREAFVVPKGWRHWQVRRA
jgi:hypothetical protein